MFDACLKSRVRALHDTTHRQATGQQTVADVLEKKGKAFIIAEGTGCQIAWLAADIRPELVAGIIAVEPAGPPFGESGVKDRNNHQRWLWSPRYRQDVRRYGLTDIPLSYDPPLPPPVNILDEPNGRPKLNLQAVLSPEPGDCKGQRIFLQADCSVPGPLVGVKATDASPVRTLFQLQKVPHVVITAPASSHALYDHATVAFMRQAGLDVTWERLGERGIHGNGNLMFLETNSDEIAKLIEGHLHRLTPPHAPISNGVETQVDGSSQKQ